MNQEALIINVRVQDLTEHVKVLTTEKNRVTELLNDKVSEYEEVNYKLDNKKREYYDFSSRLRNSQEELSVILLDTLNAHNRLSSRENELSKNEKQFEDYKNAIYAELDTKQKQAIDKIDELNDTIQLLSSNIDSKTQQIQFLSEQKDIESSEIKSINKTIKELSQDVSKLENDKIQLIKGLQETTSIIVERIDVTEKELEDKLGTFKRKEREFEQREKALLTREDNLKILTGRLQNQIHEYFPTLNIKLD